MSAFHHIVKGEVIGLAKVRVTFEDGEIRDLDLSDELDGPVFEPLRDPELFAQFRIEFGALEWPTGAGLDPMVIYECLPPLNAKKVTPAA